MRGTVHATLRHIYLINLDRSPDRLRYMRAQLDRLPVEVRRIPGVDGNSLILDPSLVDEKAFRRRHHAVLRRGEVGCYLSHVKALEQFLKDGHTFCIILEDDVKIGPEFLLTVSDLARSQDKWDVVKLHATHANGLITRHRFASGTRLVSMLLRHGSAAAYVVNRKAAESLLSGLLPMTVPYDHEFDRAWKYGLKLRATFPFPVSRAQFDSTIVGSPLVRAERVVNRKMHRPWYQQGGMVAFRGANDIARIFHETIGSLVR